MFHSCIFDAKKNGREAHATCDERNHRVIDLRFFRCAKPCVLGGSLFSGYGHTPEGSPWPPPIVEMRSRAVVSKIFKFDR